MMTSTQLEKKITHFIITSIDKALISMLVIRVEAFSQSLSMFSGERKGI